MEKYRKKDMLQTVDTLLNANDAIVRTVRANPQGVAEALVQCQESAITLGNCLETFGETYARLVQILEEYCENIYQMSENLSDGNVCRKLSKKIQKQLAALRNGIIYDMPEDKKEVVFLPYKASMWDSLESVWRAADADPNCNAYVIPIPYFDKNPDGSFREEHYEGDLYPKDVSITRYDEYDLEAQHPDVIYIHNPYDECNHVTSVHPYFYSKNLKNYTDKLVYIPYFILDEIEPDNQTAIEGMKHFCFMPGTIYADQVIVQSENMRQIYINEYMKAAKEMGLGGEHVDRKFLENKFLGTGSPKIDKVLNTKKEDLEIPEEWLRIIEKPNGTWKKIFFYNTSVSALLTHSENMIRKMESVFEIFKENRDEVALLWRPHPLIQATIESMRPQLWEQYQKLRDRYIEEGWGIYDDSADVDRAVILSDVYYGDGSSVVGLCQKKRMPVMLQDMIMENFMFADSSFFVDGEDLWLLTGYSDVLMHFCRSDMTLIEYFIIPAKYLQRAVHFRLENTEKGIYILPHMANNFFYFDKQIKTLKEISLPPVEPQLSRKRKIRLSAFWNGNLVLLGYDIPYIYFLNDASEEITTNNTYLDELQAAGAKKGETIFSHCACRDENKFYIPLTGQAFILCIDLEEKSFRSFRVTKNDDIRLCTIDKYGYDEKFLLTTYDDERIIWSPENGVEELQKIGLLNKGEAYLRAYHIADKNYYIPAKERKIYVEQGNCIRDIPYVSAPNAAYPEHGTAQYETVYRDGSDIFFQTRSGELFFLDTAKDEISAMKFQVSADQMEELKKRILEAREIPPCVMEQSCFCLKDYIKSIM